MTSTTTADVASPSDDAGAVPTRPWSDYAAYLFDLDGVVTRTAVVHATAWKRLFDGYLQERASRDGGGAPRPFDIDADYRQYVDGRPRYDGVATFLASRGISLERGTPDDGPDVETCAGLGNRKDAYFTEVVESQGVDVFSDAVEVLEAVRAAGIPTAVVSASANCEALLRRVGLLDRFDVRVSGVEAAQWGLAGKPRPDTFLKAADLLGVRPADAVVLEDAISGVLAGRAGHFGLVVGVDRIGQPEDLAENGADIVLSDLRDLLRVVPVRPEAPALVHPEVPTPDLLVEAVVLVLPVEESPDGTQQPTAAEGQDEHPSLDELVSGLRAHGVDVVVTNAVESGSPGSVVAELAERQRQRGVGSGLLLVTGAADGLELPPVAARARVVAGGLAATTAVLRDQLERRVAGRVPSIDEDPAWTITVSGDALAVRRPHRALLTVSDSQFGTRGSREEDGPGTHPKVLAAGVYDDVSDPPTLLEGPSWTGLHVLRHLEQGEDRRTLDLRTGVLSRHQPAYPVPLRTVRFATLARPGGVVLRAEGSGEWLRAGAALRPPATDGSFLRRQEGATTTAETRTGKGGAIAAAAHQEMHVAGDRHVVERIGCLRGDREGASRLEEAVHGLGEMREAGFDALLAEQREAWARRWDETLVCIDGDPAMELAVRFSLFHLMGSAPTEDEAAVGARGITGPDYKGHVFWDTDVFMLPFFAATAPSAARAMLEYRIRRLGPAYEAAAREGRTGARFAWESARTGADVTPREIHPLDGPVIPIHTGTHEDHIVADVAWAAVQYAAWTGDEDFLRGPGRPLVLDTARYWASRVRVDAEGRAHIDNVIGPDEYHELVDDNVFTNVMARWNLRRAAELAEEVGGVGPDEVARWRGVADALVDNYDPETRLYEQFVGYHGLEPLIITQMAQTPIAADMVLGRPRIQQSQVVKQPDVLMLHHLVPEETVPGSLHPNMEFYEPRTAHGSSLSPAIHAGLLAREERWEDSLRLFTMACRLDLDNLNHTTAGGLHMATFGGVWQALVFGYLGMRPEGRALRVDPRVPPTWERLRLRLRFRGVRLHVEAGPESMRLWAEGEVPVVVPGSEGTSVVGVEGADWVREGDGWRAR
ncbi:MAG TPA: beta-phosphoglucomutase family hydrolase [Dermatophilaceae bacterium]|nr:beta-phosphoglucomutase family hydrolase [Dermatophilaceae bacterium]